MVGCRSGAFAPVGVADSLSLKHVQKLHILDMSLLVYSTARAEPVILFKDLLKDKDLFFLTLPEVLQLKASLDWLLFKANFNQEIIKDLMAKNKKGGS